VSALHKLCEMGTKASKERGAAALFELEEDKRPKKKKRADGDDADDGTGTGLSSAKGSKVPPPHVMVSYNWDHQEVILRVVGSLQSRGYLVWVDTEQMKGATVDTMALAVEGSAVVLLGVSRAYKESSNCRMEAQYALQKKKPLVPLMLVEGYEADGWLGLLLGTSMWYALYGSTLTSEGAFEDRMDGLCRELGTRGRADADGVLDGDDAAEEQQHGTRCNTAIGSDSPGSNSTVQPASAQGLQLLKVSVLKKQAVRDAGATEEQLEAADDADDVKSFLIDLIVQHAEADARSGSDDVMQSLRSEVGGWKISTLKKRAASSGVTAQALLDADDADDVKGRLIELIAQAEATEGS
jgi:hypothetical protein